MKRIVAVVLSMALAGSVIPAQAQQGTTAPTTKSVRKRATPKTSGPTISTQLSEMKQAIDAQQQQIKQLSDLVQSRDQKIQQLELRLDQSQTVATQAQTKADTAVAQTAEQEQTVATLKNDVTDLKSGVTNSVLNLQETQKRIGELESPLAIHFKGITITADSWRRNRCIAIARWGRTSILPSTAFQCLEAVRTRFLNSLAPARSRESRCSLRASSITPNSPAMKKLTFFRPA